MVRIRLMRVGKRKQPSYRVVVADSRSPRDGRIIEAIGHYQPRLEPSGVSIDTDRAQYWIDRGAQPSNQVRKLLTIASSGGAQPAAEEPKKAPAKVKATPAASVADEAREDDEAGAAELPEAVDQASAAPEAETGQVPGSEAADGEGDEG